MTTPSSTGDAIGLHAAARQRIEDRTATVCIVGQGYVGLPAAMRASEVGFPTMQDDTATSLIVSVSSWVSAPVCSTPVLAPLTPAAAALPVTTTAFSAASAEARRPG